MATVRACVTSRKIVFMAMTVLMLATILMPCLITASHAQSPGPQRESDDTKARLLVIELFFLFVGLLIILFLGILIWLSRRRKKRRTGK